MRLIILDIMDTFKKEVLLCREWRLNPREGCYGESAPASLIFTGGISHQTFLL